MNLRDLRYIITLAETKHFGQAAERCFVSQPTLSGQVKKLEDELGVCIFERSKRSVELTPIGTTIIAHARAMMEQVYSMEQAAKSQHGPLSSSLRIGAILTLSPYLTPVILRPLTKRYPNLKLALVEDITDNLLQRLYRYELDAALIATVPETPELTTIPLFDEPFWLAHPRNHPLGAKDQITQQDLEQLDLLLLSEGHCLAQQMLDICKLASRPQHGKMGDLQAASLETILQLVAVGFGATLLPALATRGAWTHNRNIVIRPLKLPNTYRRISLVFRRKFPRRHDLQAFAQVMIDNLPDTVTVIEPQHPQNS